MPKSSFSQSLRSEVDSGQRAITARATPRNDKHAFCRRSVEGNHELDFIRAGGTTGNSKVPSSQTRPGIVSPLVALSSLERTSGEWLLLRCRVTISTIQGLQERLCFEEI